MSSSTSRPKCLAGAVRSAQTLGLTHPPSAIMAQPTKYWRINFASIADFDRMLAEGILICPTTGLRSLKYDPEDCIARRMKKGEGIFLGKLDEDTGKAHIQAIGVIQDQKPATTVRWKRISKTVFPNPQGGVPPWRERCFLFDGSRAEAYNFAAEFELHFSDA